MDTICYTIDYGAGTAEYWTPTTDEAAVLREFCDVASTTFGIRKNMTGEPRIISAVARLIPTDQHGATHALFFWGDEFIYDKRWRTEKGRMWILQDAWGNLCTCERRGTPQASCEVHAFDLEHGTVYQESV